MEKISLFQLDRNLKLFLTVFLMALVIGVTLGLVFLFETTFFNKTEAQEKFKNNVIIEEDFGFEESNSKTTAELLMTTHNHILGFSFIFFFVGAIFYFNSVITGFWKYFLMIEPLISTVISFLSIWGVRLLHEDIIYITIISSIIAYSSFYFMVFISFFELNLKRRV